MRGETTKAMPVSIVEEERRRRRGPDRTRALRGSAIGLPPRRRPQGWRACLSAFMRAQVSGPPADVAVFMTTSTKAGRLVHDQKATVGVHDGAFLHGRRPEKGPGIAVTALRSRYNERGDFLVATTPPADESSRASSAELVFPHLVDGRGYTTQFVLIAGSPGPSVSGVLRTLSRSGVPLGLLLR